jgi:hypothetical protein
MRKFTFLVLVMNCQYHLWWKINLLVLYFPLYSSSEDAIICLRYTNSNIISITDTQYIACVLRYLWRRGVDFGENVYEIQLTKFQTLYQQIETFKSQCSLNVPPNLTFRNTAFSTQSTFLCFMYISEITAIISLNYWVIKYQITYDQAEVKY